MIEQYKKKGKYFYQNLKEVLGKKKGKEKN